MLMAGSQLSQLPSTETCPHEDQGIGEPGVTQVQLYMTAVLATQGP